ncbi:MAG: diguanylate cyclase domain-containing protein [Cyanobacteriota bacterium]|jgi:diguanylate cyclase (GGDEF)-like protein/PAS domain S-box-containing protein
MTEAMPVSVPESPLRRRISQLPQAVMVLGLLITAGILIQNILFNRRYHEQAEIALLDDVSDALQGQMNAISASVAGISAMAEANGSLTPENFRRYTEDLRNAHQLPPGILGLGYARYVPQADKASFEATLAATYGQPVPIRPSGVRPAYAPVTVLQPMDHRNSRAIGFDLLSEPVRRESLLEAARSGSPVLTARLQLMQSPQGDREPGVILYTLIRRDRDALPSSPQAMEEQVWGWASSPIRINDLMEVTLRGINNPNLQGSTVLLFDGERPSRFGRLYDPTQMFETPKLSDPNYQLISVGGRSWLVGVQLTRALPGPDGLHWSQAVILLVGSLISALAAMVARELVLSHRRTLEALNQVSEAAEDLAIAAAVFEGTVEGVVITNLEGRVMSLNQSFTQITGYSLNDLRGKSLRVLRSGKHEDSFYGALWDQLLKEGSWHREVWNKCKNGSIRLHDVSITTVTDKRLQPLHFVAMYQDITARYTEQQAILHQATHDPLTGLANRTLLVDRLEQALAMAQRYGYMVGLLFMDLDGFKAVNDNFGHDVGDELLIAVSRRLEDFLRKTDTLCRQGGDEFVLLLPQAPDLEALMGLAERILAVVREPFTNVHGCAVVKISVSIGIARWPEHGADTDALMQAADRAMYLCKQSGNQQPVLAEPQKAAA